jgi:hypothetical protein
VTLKSVADVEGPWSDPQFDSSLIAGCKKYWDMPINELPDLMVATYLNQGFAIKEMLNEARDRIQRGSPDDTELYDGQLAETVMRLGRNQ